MMSWVTRMLGLGGDATETVSAVADGLDGLFTSDDERLTHREVIERLKQEPAKAQMAINAVEAQHRTLFVAGGRPFILWICGFGLAFMFLVNPVLQWITGEPGPQLPEEIIMNLVLGMLGLGGLRTFEKLKGLTK